MARHYLGAEEIARLKWVGINEKSLEELEARQRERIKALKKMLEEEKQELEWIIAARSQYPMQHEHEFGSIHAPARYSTKLTWKDKIILVIAEAKRPVLAREIAPTLESWEPMLKGLNVPNVVSVLLTRMVRDGALVRTKRKGQAGSLYSLPE
jgi:hypothetical protein